MPYDPSIDFNSVLANARATFAPKRIAAATALAEALRVHGVAAAAHAGFQAAANAALVPEPGMQNFGIVREEWATAQEKETNSRNHRDRLAIALRAATHESKAWDDRCQAAEKGNLLTGRGEANDLAYQREYGSLVSLAHAQGRTTATA